MAAHFDKLQFEPHNGYGTVDMDGEPWPFGYISTSPTPIPVFELNVILKHPRALLEDLAIKMAAAPEMFAAASEVLNYATLDGILENPARHDNEVFGIRIGDLRRLAAALSKLKD
jgi:hypothetical protein